MNQYQPHASKLQLVASADAWRIYSARKSDPKFGLYKKKILQRDKDTCQFCGFQSSLHQDVINLDGNYYNNKSENLITACCFCAQCFFLESVGVGGYGGGTLVYVPEMTQADLNVLCHVLFCAITNDTGYKATAQSIYLGFKIRSQQIEDKFGEGTSDPAIFGHLLIDSDLASHEKTTKILDGIRLLPSRARFRSQIESWAATALQDISAKNDN